LLKHFLLSFFLFSSVVLAAQKKNIGNSIFVGGLVFNTGTHVRGFGVFLKTSTLVDNNIQFNSEIRWNYFFRYLGPPVSFHEWQVSGAVLFAYGKKRAQEVLFFGRTINHSGYSNAIAYSYNVYLNKIGTAQQTGTINLQFGDFYFLHENDLLARPRLDRFRTAAIQVGVEKDNFRLALTQSNWTGQMGAAIKSSKYPAMGYLDTTNGRYTHYSHGLLYASLEMADSYTGQQLKIGAGVDAERIRHAVQNRFIHDACLLPASFRNPNNYHIPMLQENGQPYLFEKGQKIKYPREFLMISLNGDVMY
jgi:hypothetical protein